MVLVCYSLSVFRSFIVLFNDIALYLGLAEQVSRIYKVFMISRIAGYPHPYQQYAHIQDEDIWLIGTIGHPGPTSYQGRGVLYKHLR